MSYFNFNRLIEKYSKNFSVIPAARGRYSGGVWEAEEGEEYVASGAVMPLSQNKLYQLGGAMKAQDRYLYMTEPIKSPLDGAKVRIENNVYKVEASRDNGREEFTGVYVYILKWVSVFDKAKGD